MSPGTFAEYTCTVERGDCATLMIDDDADDDASRVRLAISTDENGTSFVRLSDADARRMAQTILDEIGEGD